MSTLKVHFFAFYFIKYKAEKKTTIKHRFVIFVRSVKQEYSFEAEFLKNNQKCSIFLLINEKKWISIIYVIKYK